MITYGLLVIDVQEKLFPHMEMPCDVLDTLQKAVQGFSILNLPIIATLQAPEKLGGLIKGVSSNLPDDTPFFSKTSFSCLKDQKLREAILSSDVTHWVLTGIESHVCVLQTAKDLLKEGKQTVVLNDAISSRSIFDYSTAIAEIRDLKARVTSLETLLFELIQDAEAPLFKPISTLLK